MARLGRTMRKMAKSQGGKKRAAAAPRKKKKSVVSKAHKLGKKVGKAGAVLGAVGGDPVMGGVVKAIAGRHKGGKKRIKRAAKHMAAGTTPKGRKVKKVLKRATARKAAGEKAFKGKYGKLGNKIAAQKPAAKKAKPGARNPAAKPAAKAAAPRARRGRKSGLRR